MGDGRERQPWERARVAKEEEAAAASLRRTLWADWRRARVQDLMHFSKHPRREATKIADDEMKLLQCQR